MIGPFASYASLNFEQRLVYCALIAGLGVIVGVAIREVFRFMIETDSIKVDAAITAAQALVIGPLLWVINTNIYGFARREWASLLEHVVTVLAVALMASATRDQFRAINRRASTENSALDDEVKEDSELPEFVELIDEPLRGPVLRVSADDHYLHIVTSKGSSRVLMRFRDALVQLRSMPGYRIHRSHWVAAPRLRRVRSEGRRHVAELTCGAELPVSRAYLDDLRRDGYLD
jgi:hypothetical protein